MRPFELVSAYMPGIVLRTFRSSALFTLDSCFAQRQSVCPSKKCMESLSILEDGARFTAAATGSIMNTSFSLLLHGRAKVKSPQSNTHLVSIHLFPDFLKIAS